MKNISFAFIFITTLLISSCDSSQEETNTNIEEKADTEMTEADSDELKEMKERQGSTKKSTEPTQPSNDDNPTSETKIDPLEVPVEISNINLLHGKWENTEQPGTFLMFDEKTRTETIAGISQSRKDSYTLSNICMNTSNAQNSIPLSENSYISCIDIDMCWFIIELDKEHLSLGDLATGNPLTYKRVE